MRPVGRPTVIHEDDHLIVVSKPSGMAPLPSRSGTPGPPAGATLIGWLRRSIAGSEARGLRLVYAPENDASGLAVFARSELIAESIKTEFTSRKADRLAYALVLGEMKAGEGAGGGTIQTQLRRDRDGLWHSIRTDEFSGPRAAPGPRRGPPRAAASARTHYRLVRSANGLSLVRLRLETDRPHQARVHMAELGHPIVGDRLYGRPEPGGRRTIDRLGLHIAELSFTHPGTKQSVRFSSPPPPEFRRAVGDEGAGEKDARARDAGVGWEDVAEWYDELIAERGSDHYEQVILPGTLRLLASEAGTRVLDVACGQGVLSRLLNERGVQTVGVDASQRLIESATARSGPLAQFLVGDARELPGMIDDLGGPASFDAAACVMALMNIDPVEPLLRGCAALLKPGAPLVVAVLHPAFRAPGRTAWGWDKAPDGSVRQYRRVDAYLSVDRREIVMNPGGTAAGANAITTPTFLRPIGWYIARLADAGFVIDSVEEWISRRVSQPGPRADEENRARGEIPLFLAIRARVRG
ncbi:MAG: methyltransferase domain-containing protein [Phycisphaeraceae bacterium]|nr:methyltransferase domain-containing protein [Phycisphaeraceae bacterium]